MVELTRPCFALCATELPPDQLINRSFLVEGSRSTLGALGQKLIQRNPKAKIVSEPRDSALRTFKETGDYMAWLRARWDAGQGAIVQDEADLSNGLYKDWNPRRVDEFL